MWWLGHAPAYMFQAWQLNLVQHHPNALLEYALCLYDKIKMGPQQFPCCQMQLHTCEECLPQVCLQHVQEVKSPQGRPGAGLPSPDRHAGPAQRAGHAPDMHRARGALRAHLQVAPLHIPCELLSCSISSYILCNACTKKVPLHTAQESCIPTPGCRKSS